MLNREKRNKLIEDNLKLVGFVYRKYYMSKFPDLREDLISEGTFGLIMAVDNFKEDKGAKFSTYACLAIRGQMHNYIKKHYALKRKAQREAISLYQKDKNDIPLIDTLTETDFIEDSIEEMLEYCSFPKTIRLLMEGYNKAEVSRIMGCTRQAIHSRMERDKKNIRKYFTGEQPRDKETVVEKARSLGVSVRTYYKYKRNNKLEDLQNKKLSQNVG